MKRLLLIAAFAALTSAQGAFAWGRLGHAAVARLAEQHLTKKAKANLDKLLDGRSIVYYASWMDDYKPQMLVDLGYTPTNGPRMHMLPHTFSVDESGEVIRGNRLPGDKYLANCLYYVERAADRLKNRMHEMNDSTRLACIQVIVHCLGDMHCPGHVRWPDNQEIGYFNVVLKGSEIRYHTIWDTPIVATTHPWSLLRSGLPARPLHRRTAAGGDRRRHLRLGPRVGRKLEMHLRREAGRQTGTRLHPEIQTAGRRAARQSRLPAGQGPQRHFRPSVSPRRGLPGPKKSPRHIGNSDLFCYICARGLGTQPPDGPIAQSVRAADS